MEQGGVNLYEFVKNQPIFGFDVLGLKVGRIEIYGGHNSGEENGEVVPGAGLEGNYQTDVKNGIEKRKTCEKVGFVGCGMDSLNGISNQQGFGVPGIL